MYYKQQRRKLRLKLTLFAGAGILVIILCLAIVVKATARSMEATVLDGDKSYSLNVGSADPDTILAAAQAQGMPELSELDQTEFDGAAHMVTIYRGAEMIVNDQGEIETFTVHKGITVEEALAENGISLGAEDMVTPGREMAIAASLSVEIKRCHRVMVSFEGQTQEVTLYGGTVADALKEAGLRLTEDMTCEPSEEMSLEDGMTVLVTRLTSFSLTIGGETKAYQVSADTVGDALEKCGITLGTDDRLNVSPDKKLRAGMRLVLQRVEVKEEKETQEIAYGTQYVTSRELPEGQTQRLSAGLAGEKELVYRSTYVDGKLEDRELLSEKVVSEPVKEIIKRGIGYQTEAPKLEFIDDGSASTPAPTSKPGGKKPAVTVNAEAGTLTDPWGNEIPFTKTITGTCTAYCIPGGTTSVGLEAVRGVIAVDPDIIPYGTRMYVASPDGKIVYGYGVAGDTGGACLAGDIIADLCYDTLAECDIIGRREMVLYILQ